MVVHYTLVVLLGHGSRARAHGGGYGRRASRNTDIDRDNTTRHAVKAVECDARCEVCKKLRYDTIIYRQMRSDIN